MARVLTVKQAAELLQADADTVRDWLRRGRIPGRRIGRDWRISEEALHEWLKGGPARQRVDAFGMLAHLKREGEEDHTEAFLREKHEEAAREEERLAPRSGADPQK